MWTKLCDSYTDHPKLHLASEYLAASLSARREALANDVANCSKALANDVANAMLYCRSQRTLSPAATRDAWRGARAT